jgi:stearoyl-CoA desaturase (Delta-9 desaturase)
MVESALDELATTHAPSRERPAPTERWATRLRGAGRLRSLLGLAVNPLVLVHVAALVGVILSGWSWTGLALAFGFYFVRMVVVTLAYHRYFSHRAFKTSRIFQLLLAIGAQSNGQRGVLWWAGHHRWHHKHSDDPEDVHSPIQRGLWFSHIGWIIGPTWDKTDYPAVADLARFPELRFLNRPWVQHLPIALLGLALLIAGPWWFVWGFLVSTVLVWHGSFSVNSLAHVIGRRRFETGDGSRNSWLLALFTSGEGWHNNHHRYQSSANQGFRWWEIDVTYYVLRLLAGLGLVWDLRRPPPEVLESALAPSEVPSTANAPAALQPES